MALTTGAWLSAPTKKTSFFARLLRAQIEARGETVLGVAVRAVTDLARRGIMSDQATEVVRL